MDKLAGDPVDSGDLPVTMVDVWGLMDLFSDKLVESGSLVATTLGV